MFLHILLVAAFLVTTASGANQADREALLGTWHVDEADSQEIWTLESTGTEIKVVRTRDGKVTLDTKCTFDGKDCDGRDEGKKVSVSMYFNGSSLVQLETRDGQVTTRTFSLDGGNDRLAIDVNPITSSGKRYAIKLKRQLVSASK